LILAPALACPSFGCGTTLNMAGVENLQPFVDVSVAADAADYTPTIDSNFVRPAYPFGGVGNDVAWLKSADRPLDVLGAIADMPFSLVGDVITFPWAAFECLVVVRPQAHPDGASGQLTPDTSLREQK
jgi:hypothetical protein